MPIRAAAAKCTRALFRSATLSPIPSLSTACRGTSREKLLTKGESVVPYDKEGECTNLFTASLSTVYPTFLCIFCESRLHIQTRASILMQMGTYSRSGHVYGYTRAHGVKRTHVHASHVFAILLVEELSRSDRW
jgi:hypothetical protein